MDECLVCAESFSESRLQCIGSCDHVGVCSICCFRMRYILRDFTCSICKSNLEQLICVTKENERKFREFEIWGEHAGPEFSYDHKSRIFFPRGYVNKVVETLLTKQCTVCDFRSKDIRKVKLHINDHNLKMCQLCIDNKRVFPSEHTTYSSSEFDKHLRSGDKEGGEGHPNCTFCKRRYYDKTALFLHLQKDHETCHICVRDGIKYRYFHDYTFVEKHYERVHYPCKVYDCMQKKFVVFSNEIDYIAHMLDCHPHMQVDYIR